MSSQSKKQGLVKLARVVQLKTEVSSEAASVGVCITLSSRYLASKRDAGRDTLLSSR